MTDKEILINTFINAYKDFEIKCEIIDQRVLKWAYSKNVFIACKKINDLTDEKIAICNAKVLIDEALAGIKRKKEIELYLLGEDTEQIAKHFGCDSVQMVRSRIIKQKHSVIKNISKKYDIAYLLNIASKSLWLMCEYKELRNTAEQKQIAYKIWRDKYRASAKGCSSRNKEMQEQEQ